jgi:hypothetical protein
MGGRAAEDAAERQRQRDAAARQAAIDAQKAGQAKIEEDLAQIERVASTYGGLPPDAMKRMIADKNMRDMLTSGYEEIRAKTPGTLPTPADVQDLIRRVALTGGQQAVDAFGNRFTIGLGDEVWAHSADTDRSPIERMGGDIGNAFSRAWQWLRPGDGRREMAPGGRVPIMVRDANGVVRQAYVGDANNGILSETDIEAMFQPKSGYGAAGQRGIRYRLPVNMPPDKQAEIIRLQRIAEEYLKNGDVEIAEGIANTIQSMFR